VPTRLSATPALQRLLRQSPGGARPVRAAADDHVGNRSILDMINLTGLGTPYRRSKFGIERTGESVR
jgi:hypothetical protein